MELVSKISFYACHAEKKKQGKKGKK